MPLSLPPRDYIRACMVGIPRSGTTLLRSYLNAHPDILFHNEIFHANPAKRAIRPSAIPASVILNGKDPLRYLNECIFPADPRGKKVIGFKLFRGHADMAGWHDLWTWAMNDPGCCVLFIERRNLLDMVLSMESAKKDGLWHRRWGMEGPEPPSVRLTFDELAWHLNAAVQHRNSIREALSRRHHLKVVYEDLVSAPQRTLDPVLEYLRIPNVLLHNSDRLRKKATRSRRETLTNFDALRDACARKRPEWLPWFDDAENADVHDGFRPAFYMQVYKDADLARGALQHLRRQYPAARVIVQSDGDDAALTGLAKEYGAECHAGRRLYGRENGGAMLQRMLEVFLAGGGSVLVKMDTDTRIDRTFSNLPEDRAVYGTPLRRGPPQGGCVLIPRVAAEAIASSGVLLSAELLHPQGSWGARQYTSFLEEHMQTTDRLSFEWVLHWACEKLRIPVRPAGEIHSTWKEGILNERLRFAAVHPDKFLHIPDEDIHRTCMEAHTALSRVYLDALYHANHAKKAGPSAIVRS